MIQKPEQTLYGDLRGLPWRQWRRESETLGRPAGAGVDDWVPRHRAKRKFRSGVRGTNPKDREGRLMRPMARALPDEDAIRNVIAYSETLKP